MGLPSTQVTTGRINPEGILAGIAPMPSAVPDLYTTGPAIKDKMLELIEGATDYILIDSFIARTDSTTREVKEALKAKHDAGVRVYVVADSCSWFMPGGKVGYKFLKQAGMPHVEFNPFRPHRFFYFPVMIPRDHRKFWIVDGKVLFLGGANIFGESLLPPEEGGNIDYMVAVKSPRAIEHMIESFVVTWNRHSPEKLRSEEFAVSALDAPETQVWLFDQNGHVKRRGVIGEMYDTVLSLAKEEVWLVHAYTFTSRGIMDRIKALTERGIAVNLMLSARSHAPRYTRGALYGIKDILDAGCKVWMYEGGRSALHSKGVIVDGRWASVGSANFNRRSCGFSEEANVVFGDEKSVGKVLRDLEELKTRCRPVEKEEARRYRNPWYYLTWLVMQILG